MKIKVVCISFKRFFLWRELECVCFLRWDRQDQIQMKMLNIPIEFFQFIAEEVKSVGVPRDVEDREGSGGHGIHSGVTHSGE